MNEMEVVNSSSLIQGTTGGLTAMSTAMQEFKDFIKNELIDGIDYGVIPNAKACLFKSGGEKVQMFMGLTPQYKLLNRTFIPNQEKKDRVWNDQTRKYEIKETIRNYYAWEFSCELYHGEVKVAEGVGMANTEEEKYVRQYTTKTADGMANTVMKIAKKRSFMDAILAVSGLSDLFTQDLDDNEDVKKLKVNKDENTKLITKAQIKTVFANLGALGLVKTDLDTIVNELGYTSIKEVKATDVNKVLTAIKEMAKERKGE